ncbi:MAG: glycoside hydrolase family 19 protein [Bosea sp. (in: a-proteobacteria)]
MFFAELRKGLLGPTLSQDEVSGCGAVLDAMAGLPPSWTAYALATAYHETAHTMQPIKEFGGPAYLHRMYDIQGQRPDLARRNGNLTPGDGVKYCGRGYVQLTWKPNYKKAGDKLGVDLVGNPDRAMEPKIAADIMRLGMVEGWFTGKKLADYLPGQSGTRQQFRAARRIINGIDKDALIAGYAVEFQAALKAAGA